jgi:hypothetical protein
MDDAVFFVREPPIARIEGGNVYVEVASGGRVFRFEGPISVFIATFAHFGAVAKEWRDTERTAEILPFRCEYQDSVA